jgi:hypothetical protein
MLIGIRNSPLKELSLFTANQQHAANGEHVSGADIRDSLSDDDAQGFVGMTAIR